MIKVRASARTRIYYCIQLLFVTSLSACLLSRVVTGELIKAFQLKETCLDLAELVAEKTRFQLYCLDMLSVSGSYRVFGCLALFHTLMALFTIRCHDSKSLRARIHNGFWPLKVLLVTGLILGSFFIEVDADIERPIMYVGLSGACVFIIVQLMCLMDFSSNWALSWERAADTDGSGWLCLIGFTSTSLSMMFFASCYLMYKVFVERVDGLKCSENALILCFNGLSSTVLLLTSMFCLSQRSRSAVLQCSIVSVYISFLTASALTAFPAKEIRGSLTDTNSSAVVVATKIVKCRNYAVFGFADEQMEIGTAYLFHTPAIIGIKGIHF